MRHFRKRSEPSAGVESRRACRSHRVKTIGFGLQRFQKCFGDQLPWVDPRSMPVKRENQMRNVQRRDWTHADLSRSGAAHRTWAAIAGITGSHADVSTASVAWVTERTASPGSAASIGSPEDTAQHGGSVNVESSTARERWCISAIEAEDSIAVWQQRAQ